MMLKKIIIAVLLVTVVGAIGAAIVYNRANQDTAFAADAISPLANGQQNGASEQATQNQPDQAGSGVQSEPVAQGMEGDPWQATGTVAAVDDFGFDLTTENGETVYIELGPPDYWQSQGVELVTGQTVTVDGSLNEGLIHASQVTLSDSQVLQVRSDSGLPLWSGGANNGGANNGGTSNGQGQNGQSTGLADGSHTPDPQAQVDEWVTLEGTLIAYQGGSMTMSTTDGSIITFQTGQPRFFSSQGVTFQVGDAISVLGFYEGDQFSAGEITQLSTGLRVMLRDPNGRPLWAGPGSNGSGGNGNGGGGNGGNGNGNGGSHGNGGGQG